MKISVVTASYNYQEYIKQTIQSVLDQTYQDWEMIIVDDGSIDNSIEVIRSYCEKDSRIKLFTHENKQNKGLAETVKLGIEKAQGEWIVFLESDDLINPDYMSKKLEVIKQHRNDINLIFNDCEFFGDSQKTSDFEICFRKTRKNLARAKYPRRMFYNFYLSNKIFTFSAVMAKREDLLKMDFTPSMDSHIDWWLWVQMAYLGKFYYIPEKLTKWRLHVGSYIYKIKHNSPIQLQVKIYLEIFKKYKNYFILLYIPVAQIIWWLQQIKKNSKKYIKNLILKKNK